MAVREDPTDEMHDSIDYWESAGWNDDSEALDAINAVLDHINKRVEMGDVDACYIEANHEDFDARADEKPIITVWVTSHSNDGKTLPPRTRGFRKLDTAEVDMRRF